MRRLDDYRDEMTRSLSDRNVDRVMGGDVPPGSELEPLTLFVSALRTEGRSRPDPARARATAAEAAEIVRAAEPGERAGAVARAWRRAALAAATVGVVLLVGATGVAAAADAAIPGDTLYSIDRAVELIGLGDGGVEERIEEAEQLMANGEESAALAFLGETLQQASSEGDADDADKVQTRIELAITEASPGAESAQNKVDELKSFIEENKGPAGDLDGAAFGKRVSEIAKDGDTPAPRDVPGPSQDGHSITGPDPTSAPPGDRNSTPPGQTGNQGQGQGNQGQGQGQEGNQGQGQERNPGQGLGQDKGQGPENNNGQGGGSGS